MKRFAIASTGLAALLVVAYAVHVRAWEPPFQAGYPYNFYYGSLHSHTAFSDGGHPNNSTCASSTTHAATDAAPADAFSYARGAGLDFLEVSDHNHLFNDACVGCSGAQVVQRYHDGLATAASSTVDGAFVAMYGMEWGYISNPDAGFPNEGHVVITESPKLFGWETGFYDVYTDASAASYQTMYQTALNNPSVWGAFGHFAHPSDGTKSAAGQGLDFNSFAYSAAGDDFIHSIAVISGPATDYSTLGTDSGARYAGDPVNGSQYSAYTSTDMFNRALSAGFHVAPATDFDTHCSNYGTATRDRTVVLATSLTKASLLDAIHHRRMFATSRKRGQLVYTMAANGTTYDMGAGSIRTQGAVQTSGSITLHVNGYDPDGATVTSIKIKEPLAGVTDGSARLVATAAAAPFDYSFTPAAGAHVYYAYVTLSTGDEMWSAPIWINSAAAPDTTAPVTSVTAPAAGATVSGTTTVSASASDNVGVTRVELYVDGVLTGTAAASPYQWSWNTTGAANGAHTLATKAYDAAANVGTSAPVSITVSNVADTTAPSSPASLTATSPQRRRADLQWTASTDNVGVTGYRVWRSTSATGGFTLIASPTGVSYSDSTVASRVTYYYYVTAVDAAGNVSAASNTASVLVR